MFDKSSGFMPTPSPSGNINDLLVRCKRGEQEACNIIKNTPDLAKQAQQMVRPRFAMGGDVQAGVGMGAGISDMPPRGFAPPVDTGMSPPESGAEEVISAMGDLLSSDEMDQIQEAFATYPVLEKVSDYLAPSSVGGEVAGEGGPTDDAIDAKLSDGEFVFTAKAVKQIGVDKLRKMMENAEAAYDEAAVSQGPNLEFKKGGFVSRRTC